MDPRLIEYERTLPVIGTVQVGLLFVVSGHPLRQESHSNGKEKRALIAAAG